MQKAPASNRNIKDRQLYSVDLNTLKIDQITHMSTPMNGEVVSNKTKEVFFRLKDSVYAVSTTTGKPRLVYVFPADFQGSITTVNADGTLLGGAKGSDAEKEIYKKFPAKSDFLPESTKPNCHALCLPSTSKQES